MKTETRPAFKTFNDLVQELLDLPPHYLSSPVAIMHDSVAVCEWGEYVVKVSSADPCIHIHGGGGTVSVYSHVWKELEEEYQDLKAEKDRLESQLSDAEEELTQTQLDRDFYKSEYFKAVDQAVTAEAELDYYKDEYLALKE